MVQKKDLSPPQIRNQLLGRLQEVAPPNAKEFGGANITRTLEAQAERAEVINTELKSIIKQRERWSRWLLILVSLIIVSDMCIIFFTGFGLMTFDGVTLPLFIASNLAQIFVLSVIVVQFLFKNDAIKQKSNELKSSRD